MDDSENMAGSDNAGISVHAGFPNPAADRHGTPLKPDQLLIRHPSSTYMFRIAGSAYEEQGIFDGDLALIDRALSPRSDDLVLTWQGEQFTIGRFNKQSNLEPWGVVSAIVHEYRRSLP